jgi:hypothetical protein
MANSKRVALTSIQSDAGAVGYDPDNPGIVVGPLKIGVYMGTGAPTFAAAVGSLYLNNAGTTTNDRLYVCSVAAGTWVAVTTAS